MEPQTQKFFKKYHIVILILLILAFVAGGIAYYYYSQYQSTQNLLKNPNLELTKQTQQLVSQVGKLIVLPKDEQPTVATVTDASKVKDQAFFANAQNGDKVLIYVKARKAILFDPNKNIIVNVAPVNIAQNQAPANTQVQVVATPTQVPVYVPPAATATPVK